MFSIPKVMAAAVIAIFAGLLLAFGAVNAFAQEVTNTTVNFDPFIAELMPYVLTFASAVIAAAVAWATKKLNDWTGIEIEAKHREALQSALMNGARSAITNNMPSGVGLDVKSVSVKTGVDFVLKSVPDAVAYFGLSPADIERHLIPKLNAIAGE